MVDEQDLIPYRATDLCGHRALVFAPHPDDETLGCGGSLALHCRHGDDVRVVFVTSGELGDWEEQPDRELCRSRREEEAARALACLEVGEWEFWRLPDRGVEADGNLIARLEQAIRVFRPTLVYAPSPLELHPDHRAVAQALRGAARGSSSEFSIAFYEVGYALPPNTLVDISAAWETKEQTIRAYESQLRGLDCLAVAQAFNRMRTLTLGREVKAAEAFRLVAASSLESDPIWRWQALQEKRAPVGHLPAVSVIVRTMDRPSLLREALASLAAQTFQDFEVIVINDGGREIGDVLAEYPGLRLNVIHLERNQGRGAALNVGVEAARGQFVSYLDDDDLYYPPHLQTLYTFLSAHDQFGAAYTDAFVARYQVNSESLRYELVERRIQDSQDFDRDCLLYWNYIHNLSVMHRREAFARVGAFDPGLELLEDWDFLIRLSQEYPFYHIPKVTAEYRLRKGGTNSMETPAAAMNEVKLRASLYRRYWDKRTPESDMLFHDRFRSELLWRRQQAQQYESIKENFADLRAQNTCLQQECDRLGREKRQTEERVDQLQRECEAASRSAAGVGAEKMVLEHLAEELLQEEAAVAKEVGRLRRRIQQQAEHLNRLATIVKLRSLDKGKRRRIFIDPPGVSFGRELPAGSPAPNPAAEIPSIRVDGREVVAIDWADQRPLGAIRDVAARVLTNGAKVAVVSSGKDAWLDLEVCGEHFPRTDGGTYAGNPAGSAEAIAHLAALRSRGVEFLLFPCSAFWWFDYYWDFARHLDASCQRVWEDDNCVIYRIDRSTPTGS